MDAQLFGKNNTLSLFRSQSTAICRNARGYLPTRLFAIAAPFNCEACHSKVSQNWGSVQVAKSRQFLTKGAYTGEIFLLTCERVTRFSMDDENRPARPRRAG